MIECIALLRMWRKPDDSSPVQRIKFATIVMKWGDWQISMTKASGLYIMIFFSTKERVAAAVDEQIFNI